MATIKHPDTFKCDVCGREIERAHSITLPREVDDRAERRKAVHSLR